MFHFVAGSHGHGRFGDDNGALDDGIGDFLAGGINIAQVGMAIASPRGGADCDENRIAVLDR